MSRTSYGYISFKIPSGDTSDDDLVQLHKNCVKGMVRVLKSYGGSLTTLKEVADHVNAPKENRLDEAKVRDIVNE